MTCAGAYLRTFVGFTIADFPSVLRSRDRHSYNRWDGESELRSDQLRRRGCTRHSRTVEDDTGSGQRKRNVCAAFSRRWPGIETSDIAGRDADW